jgi:hypothetical protein
MLKPRLVVSIFEVVGSLLSINASKTKVMQIHTHQTRNVVLPDLAINGTIVEAVHNYKLLGV